MRIEIKKIIDAETNEVWGFNMFDLTAVFVTWHREVKPKGKRSWTVVQFWDKYGRHNHLMSKEPILSNETKSEALNEILKYVKIKTWDEWKQN